jgi:putative transposase
MSHFEKLSQTIWHCQYHIVFVPKYRFQIQIGEVAKETEYCIREFAEEQGAEMLELSIQMDPVHLLVSVSPKFSISNIVGMFIDRIAIRIFNKFGNLMNKRSWDNHFWSRGYCAGTMGLDTEMVRKHV